MPKRKDNEVCNTKTRMTTFIKTKFKISDDQSNIDKYRLAENITEYHIISKLILQRISKYYKLYEIVIFKMDILMFHHKVSSC